MASNSIRNFFDSFTCGNNRLEARPFYKKFRAFQRRNHLANGCLDQLGSLSDANESALSKAPKSVTANANTNACWCFFLTQTAHLHFVFHSHAEEPRADVGDFEHKRHKLLILTNNANRRSVRKIATKHNNRDERSR